MSIQHEKTLAEKFNDLIPEGGWVWHWANSEGWRSRNANTRFFMCDKEGFLGWAGCLGYIYSEKDYVYNVQNPIPENELIREREKLAGNMPDPTEVEVLKARVGDLENKFSDALNEITTLQKYKESYESADRRWREAKEDNEHLMQLHNRNVELIDQLGKTIRLMTKPLNDK